MNARKIFRKISQLYTRHGNGKYMIGEAITQKQHAIQTAIKIKELGGCVPLQVAGLLHDIGHLPQMKIAHPKFKINDYHEKVGTNMLISWRFPSSVWRPVSMHVDAKRYLAIHPGYRSKLSEASMNSLILQGGPMTLMEQKEFRKKERSAQALLLRIADDKGKEIDLKKLPEFDEFEEMVISVLPK